MRRFSTGIVAPLLILSLGKSLALGSVTLTTAALALQPQIALAQDASTVARIAKSITVRLEGATEGSGVLVKKESNRYTVLTAWHVVESNRPGEELAVFTPDGKEHQLEQGSIQRLGQVDMAVLSFSSSSSYPVASFIDNKSVSIGNVIFVAGFPLSNLEIPHRMFRFEKGMVKMNTSVAMPNGYQLLYSNLTLPGMSGGPVLNDQGKLVGIHGRAERDEWVNISLGKAVSTGTNKAVPVSYYTQFSTGQIVRLATESSDAYRGDLAFLNPRLEQALNTPGGGAFSNLFAGEYRLNFERRFRNFSAKFPDARWSVRSAGPLKDGRPTLQVDVRGRREAESLSYELEASERLALFTEGEQIIGEEVISAQSILRSASKPLPISVLSPDAVLTGSRYDVSVIFDQPLGNAMVAGGFIGLTPAQMNPQSPPDIQLAPMHGGGLFKSVTAPVTPGSQTWAAMLVHPDGVITVTKRVRVVSNKEELIP